MPVAASIDNVNTNNRKHRRLAIAVLVVVALAIPVGLVVRDKLGNADSRAASSRHPASQALATQPHNKERRILLDLWDLPRGDPMKSAWHFDGILHLNDKALPFTGVYSVTTISGGVLVLVSHSAGSGRRGDMELFLVRKNGERKSLMRRPIIHQPVASADAKTVAWTSVVGKRDSTGDVEDPNSRTTLRLYDVTNEKVVQVKRLYGRSKATQPEVDSLGYGLALAG